MSLPPSRESTNGVEHLTGLARHLFDCTIRLNRAHAKLQSAVNEAREQHGDEQVMRAIDAAADNAERRDALAQVERVLRKTPESPVERKAREYATGRRPVR